MGPRKHEPGPPMMLGNMREEALILKREGVLVPSVAWEGLVRARRDA